MTLYHGSTHKNTDLMPGFKRTGVLLEWDEFESNEWLYATTDMAEAIRQGIYSMFNEHFEVQRVSNAGRRIIVDLYDTGNKHKLNLYQDFKRGPHNFFKTDRIYVYTLDQRPSDSWVKNINPNNRLHNEWKTQSTIKDAIRHVSEIDPMMWMGRKEIMLEFNEPGQRPFLLTC